MKKSSDIIILGIESSCDECAASVVKNGRNILSNEIFSQIDLHEIYGGVVPEIASRSHIETIDIITRNAIKNSNLTLDDIDGIAVTYGPGLIGSLLVGINFAKGLSFATGKPLIPINHIEAHIAANYISNSDVKPPFLCLVASGGHSHLIKVNDYSDYEIVARTVDDAAGEAFDKVARVLGLGYPGGPKLEKLALKGDAFKYDIPHAKVSGSKYDFSFSGVKSAVLNLINEMEMKNIKYKKEDVAAAFQKSVIDVLVEHSIGACKDLGLDTITIAGGVSANGSLRSAFEKSCFDNNIKFYSPEKSLSTDNAAMVASLGYYDFIKGKRATVTLNGVANLKVGEYKA